MLPHPNAQFVRFLALGMLLTGSINTLSTAWADRTYADGRNGHYQFDHPFFQAAGMFLGELSCLFVFYISVWQMRSKGTLTPEEDPKNHTWSPTIFMLPAVCDMTGTSLMYVGLTMTSASNFQMLRGSVVIFTGILSVVFLKRKLKKFHWFSMFLVLIGVAIVGLGGLLVKTDSGDDSKSSSKMMLGNMIIVGAQMVTAVQMCVEEKFLGGHNIPALAAVGWEGCWGLLFISVVLVIMYFIPDSSHHTDRFEDSYDALVQMSNSWKISVAICGNIVSIAFFNYFGISVTKVMSASHRMVIDSVRTLVIWGFDLALGWDKFSPVQLVGFAILLAGTVFYQEIVEFPGPPEFWGYSDHEPELLSDKDGMDDPDGVLGGLEDPAKQGPGPHKRSFTTCNEARGSRSSARQSAHTGSMTGSFVGR
eukprot:TRINITY_DN449_c0_g1_i5.p1 TRINITY_DN449_c0_g1~~TRINITY_DN449_c0_g1_i5.p1  ORF type:complete len:421 (-),score=87.63 TRINITY_DN449_c0_g1_i5:192-1454(-)